MQSPGVLLTDLDLQGILAAQSPEWSAGDDSRVIGLRLLCGFLHNELSDLGN